MTLLPIKTDEAFKIKYTDTEKNSIEKKGFWNSFFSWFDYEDDDINENNEITNATKKNKSTKIIKSTSISAHIDDSIKSTSISAHIDDSIKSKKMESTKIQKTKIINTKNKELTFFINNICNNEVHTEILNNQEIYENESFRLSNLKFRICNYLNNNDKITDYFFDMGFNNSLSTDISTLKKNTIIESNYQLREIILFNSNKDIYLQKIINKVIYLEKNNNIYINIINIIIKFMGLQCDDFKFNKFMQDYSHKNNSNILYIGHINNGLDRHKSLLFKYLCDKVNIPCCVLRNYKINQDKIFDNHSWNLILIDKCIFVVDFKFFPNKIIKPEDEKTMNYYDINKFFI